MTKSKIQQKIEKLLRLASNNPSAEEAAAAYQAAVDLAARHSLRLDDIAPEDGSAGEDVPPRDVEGIETFKVCTWGRTVYWKLRLVGALAKANRCKHYYTSGDGGGAYVYGQPSDIATVRYMFDAIAPQIDARGKAYAFGKGRRAGRSFRVGMADEISRRLQETTERVLSEARTEAYKRDGETGLARVNEIAVYVAKVEQAVERYGKHVLRLRKGSGFTGVSEDGYAAGRAAGRNVNLGGNKAIG